MKSTLFWLLMLWVPLCLGAQPKITLSQNPIAVNQSFILSVEATLQQSNVHPNFDVLERDFVILDRKRSNEVVVVNGNMTQRAIWSVELRAKKKGRFSIPAIQVGKEKTQPVVIQVNSANVGTNSAFLLEVELSKDAPYIMEEVVLTVRLLRTQPMAGATITPPQNENLIVESHNNASVHSEQRSGISYTVHQQSFSLFPTQEGTLEIDPLVVQIQSRNTIGSSVFSQRQKIRLFSDPIVLDVHHPTSGSGLWFPASAVSLSESYHSDLKALTTAQPITRSVTISVRGQLASQIPKILPEHIDGFRVYNNEAKLKQTANNAGIQSSLTQEQVFIPTASGRLHIPELSLRWFDNTSQSYQVARLEGRMLNIAAAQEEAPIQAALLTQEGRLSEHNGFFSPTLLYPVIALFALSGWLLSLFLWLRRRSQTPAQPNDTSSSARSEWALANALHYSKKSDPNQTYHSLLVYLRNLKDAQRPPSAPLFQAFEALQSYLYNPLAPLKRWDHAAMYRALASQRRHKVRTAHPYTRYESLLQQASQKTQDR